MTSDDRESLRRTAYGPDATAEERAAAGLALRELEERLRAAREAVPEESVEESLRPDSPTDPLLDLSFDPTLDPSLDPIADGADVLAKDAKDAIDDDDDDDGSGQNAGQDVGVSTKPRSIGAVWLIPIVGASLVLGYLAGLGTLDTAPQLGSIASPTPSANPSENIGTVLQLGDLEAADSWFNGTFEASDAVPNPELLAAFGLSAQDVRLAVSGGEEGSVWVGRTAAELCLIIEQTVDGAGASACIERDKFARMGIALTSMDQKVTWFGRDVTLDPPWVSTVTTPPELRVGPGDVDAANSWFAVPASSSDEFPQAMLLKNLNVDQGDVRRIVPENAPWMKLWIARQSTGGFCVFATDNSDANSEGACSPTEDFQKRGLAMMIQGHSVFWDGTSLTVSG